MTEAEAMVRNLVPEGVNRPAGVDNGYLTNAGETAKGYFVNGPYNMAAGTVSAVYNHDKTLQGLGNAVAHPLETAGRAKEAIQAKWESGNEGAGELLFDAAVIVLAPQVSAEVTVPTATLGKAPILAELATGGTAAVGTRTVVIVGQQAVTVSGGGVAGTALLGGATVVQMAAGGPSPSGGGNASSRASTLEPGPYAGESIPARGPARDFTAAERQQINEIGQETGCHTCGTKDPGTKSGDFIPDHQPPNQLNSAGGAQRLYPHCKTCSLSQGGTIRKMQLQGDLP